MRLRHLFLVLGVLGASPVWAGTCPGDDTPLTPIPTSVENVTVSTTVVTLTVPQKARQALLYVRSNTIAWTTDGSTPSTTNGLLAKKDMTLVICGNAMSRFKMVRQTGTDATVSVMYDGHP